MCRFGVIWSNSGLRCAQRKKSGPLLVRPSVQSFASFGEYLSPILSSHPSSKTAQSFSFDFAPSTILHSVSVTQKNLVCLSYFCPWYITLIAVDRNHNGFYWHFKPVCFLLGVYWPEPVLGTSSPSSCSISAEATTAAVSVRKIRRPKLMGLAPLA